MLFNGVVGCLKDAKVGLVGVLFAVTLSPLSARAAASVTLAWDPASDPSISGYNIYYGTASRSYSNAVDVGNANLATISGLLPGATYYFAATAYDSAGLESDYSGEASYTVPSTATNIQPTLNQPLNLTINENSGTQIVGLTGITSGSPTENQVLTLSAFSSNPSLVPNPAIQYTSPNTTGQLTFTPTANSYGVATITVMVDDGASVSNTVMRAFAVTVLPVNNPPTLDALSPISVNENSGPQTITLSGITPGAGESGGVTVTVSSSNPGLIPNPTVSYSNPNTTGSLTFAPVANSYGWSQLTVTVNDGQPTNNLTSQSFVVTVVQTDNGGTNSVPDSTWSIWWQGKNGLTATWKMSGTNSVQGGLLNVSAVNTSWRMAAQADFNGDGQKDILWQNTSGAVAIWLMNETNILGSTLVPNTPTGTAWRIGAVGDMDGDGMPDIVWQHTSGKVSVWFMNGTNCTHRSPLNAPLAGSGWRLAATGDFNNDGKTDLLWQSSSGQTSVWLMNGTNCINHFMLSIPSPGSGWRLVGVADVDGSGNSDLIWENDNTGDLTYWQMNGTSRVGIGRFNITRVDPFWRAMGPR